MHKATSQFSTTPTETELQKLQGTGAIPAWVRGKLVRNGPALFELESTTLQHWFDGYGMLHGFLLEDGEVFYQSKFVKSDEYLKASTSGRVETVAWGTASDPCRSMFRRFMANFTASPSNTNVNVIKVGKKYFATSDIATINEFDIDSLDTLSTFTPKKSGVMAAHPSYTDDGKVWNMASAFGPKIKNAIVAIDDAPSSTTQASFYTDKLYYFHSFGNTERYFITIEQPMKLHFPALITSGIKNKSFYECFEWDKEATNIFHIYDRDTKAVTSIASDVSFFFFHTINAYETDGVLTLDLCGYDDNSIIDDFYIDTLATSGIKEEHKASLRRVTIDLTTQKITMQDFEINFELPNINDAYRNTSHRYSYGVHSPKNNPALAVKIIKFDHTTSTHSLWGEEHLLVGEPIFIANPEGKKEDDGVIVVLCHNKQTSRAELVFLDASNLKKIASRPLPQSLPPALHGWFYHLNKNESNE